MQRLFEGYGKKINSSQLGNLQYEYISRKGETLDLSAPFCISLNIYKWFDVIVNITEFRNKSRIIRDAKTFY